MLRSVLVLCCAAVAVASSHKFTLHGDHEEEYLVQLSHTAPAAARAEHIQAMKAAGARVLDEFTIGKKFYAYHVRIPPRALLATRALLKADPVLHFERNQLYHAAMAAPAQSLAQPAAEPSGQPIARPAAQPSEPEPKPARAARVASAVCHVQRGATWGLARRNKVELEIDGLYAYNTLAAGQGTYAFILDSGILLNHQDLAGRAFWGYDAVEDPSPETDPYGHGTHVAATVGGTKWGVSKSVKLVAVRVLNQAGTGSTAGIVAGLEFVASAGADNQSLALLAFSGPVSLTLNNAISALYDLLIPVIVPAGNGGVDSCTTSPASEYTAIRVTASDSLDQWYSGNNYGNCSDLIAPGVGISSAYIGNVYSQNTLTGTSMAAANVAGQVANLLAGGYLPADMRNVLVGMALRDVVVGVPGNTTNVLLHAPCF